MLTRTTYTSARLLTLAVGGALALTACSSAKTASPGPSTQASSGGTIKIVDGWCKAVDTMKKSTSSAMEGMDKMTGCFGTLTNPGSAPVSIMGGTSTAAAVVETHETVKDANGQMVMRKVEGGFTIPAGGKFVLAPGANHVMLIKLSKPLRTGDDVAVQLRLKDGSSAPVTFAVKAFTAGNENYKTPGAPTSMPSSHS